MSAAGVDEWADGLFPAPEKSTDAGEDASAQVSREEPRRLVYSSLPEFVDAYLAPLYRRPLSKQSRPWCPAWWEHPEAVVRLEACWRAWEALRRDPKFGMSTWLLDHADRHLAVLMDPDGPFHGCSPDGGHNPDRLRPLPTDPAPPGLY